MVFSAAKIILSIDVDKKSKLNHIVGKMGRKPRPTKQVRIPLDLHRAIEARAAKSGHDITVEVATLLQWALHNKDKLSSVHLLGTIDALVEEHARLEGKRRK